MTSRVDRRSYERGDGRDVESAAEEWVRWGWQAGACRRRCRCDLQRRILAKNQRLQLLQLSRGFDPELLHQQLACIAIRLQRVGLAARAVEGQHELPAKALAEGMLGDEALELGDEVGRPAQLEIGVDPALERGEPELLEPLTLGRHERGAFEARERGTPAERERRVQLRRGDGRLLAARAVDEGLEALEIELVPAHLESISRALREDALASQDLPQAVHRDLQRVRRRRRWAVAPERVDHAVARHDLVRAQEQQREHRTLLPAAERERLSFGRHLERPENPELEPLVHAAYDARDVAQANAK